MTYDASPSDGAEELFPVNEDVPELPEPEEVALLGLAPPFLVGIRRTVLVAVHPKGSGRVGSDAGGAFIVELRRGGGLTGDVCMFALYLRVGRIPVPRAHL